MFYAKLALVLLLCIPLVLLSVFLFARLVDQALLGARREKQNRMERKTVENAKRRRRK